MINNNFTKECFKMSDDLFEILDIELKDITEMERQIISSFLFGMLNGEALEKKINPPELKGILISILINKFKYSEKQSVEFSQNLINSMDRKYNPTMYVIIHKGLEAYYDYKENKNNEIYNNLTYIIDTIVNNSNE